MNCFSKWFLPYRSMIPLILSAAVCTNAQTVSSPNAAQSWTASSQTVTDNANPSRTTESHTKSGNRTVDKKTVEVLGPNGQYQPFVVTETETIQEDAKTTRSITRTYNPDADGHEQLTQVTESETRNSADSGPNAVRTTSNLGADGSFHIVEREITKTTNGSGSQVTQTTVYLPDMNGSLAPSMEIHEQQRHGANGDIQTTKTTLLPDGKGGWRVQEVQERTVTGDAENRTTDERVSRRDFEGNVSPVSQVIVKDAYANGQRTSTAETYSVDVPGATRDNALHVVQHATTVEKKEADRTITEQQVEQPNPFASSPGLGTSIKTTDIVVDGNSGREETITVTAQYPDGNPSVVSLEKRKSDQVPAIQVQGEPSSPSYRQR